MGHSDGKLEFKRQLEKNVKNLYRKNLKMQQIEKFIRHSPVWWRMR